MDKAVNKIRKMIYAQNSKIKRYKLSKGTKQTLWS